MLPTLLTLLTFSLPSLAYAVVAGTASTEQYTNDDLFKSTALNITNSYRQQHNATALTWNDTLADTAKDWAKKCGFEHSGGPTGENLASGYENVTAGIMAWGHERTSYDYGKAEFSSKTGHFTQLVWKGTTSVGCGRSNCTGKGDAPGWYVVCEYYPPGNVQGQFKENVQKEEKGGVGVVPDESAAVRIEEKVWWVLGLAGGVVLMMV